MLFFPEGGGSKSVQIAKHNGGCEVLSFQSEVSKSWRTKGGGARRSFIGEGALERSRGRSRDTVEGATKLVRPPKGLYSPQMRSGRLLEPPSNNPFF